MLITGPASLCRIMTLVSLMIGVLISKVNCRYCCCCLFFFRSELSTANFYTMIGWLLFLDRPPFHMPHDIINGLACMCLYFVRTKLTDATHIFSMRNATMTNKCVFAHTRTRTSNHAVLKTFYKI